jgi:hypothetical protein
MEVPNYHPFDKSRGQVEGPMRTQFLRVVVLAGLGTAGLFRIVSRFLRAVVRLVFTLRAI